MTWLVAATVFLVDQFSKYLCKIYLRPLGSIPVVKGIFHLTYVENRGVAFGMLQNKGWLFVPVTLFTAAAIIYILKNLKSKSIVLKTALAMILGGALGNLYDRVFLGYVVDFLDFRIWPVFNMADSAIVVGAVLLGYFVIFKGELLENGKA